MKKCSLNHFTESLSPWLDDNYIRKVVLNDKSQVTFSFIDGVSDTYEITDCSRNQIEKICRDLIERGITVQGLE